MEKFVARKLNGSEFVNKVYFTLLSDKRESHILETDFKRIVRDGYLKKNRDI